MMKENPYMLLAKYILPSEMYDYFDLVDVAEDRFDDELRLHLYLDEKEMAPDDRTDLSPNGFYEPCCINDFPIREHRTVLHIRRRRWKDAQGRSVSKDWHLVAEGIRYSKEFAAFLKEFLGYLPDYGEVAPETISHQGR
jgi:hypothetical protein